MPSRTRQRHAGRVPQRPLLFKPTPKQDQFLNDLLTGEYKVMGFGGAIRGGKSIAGVMALFMLCRIFPGSRWAIVREDLQRIRRNTIPTIEKFAPRPFVGPLNKNEWKYVCENGSEILLIGEQLSRDPDLDRFKGLEVNGWLAEEANEIAEATANKMIERMGSWIIQPTVAHPNPAQPPAVLMCTFNPADNWVREWFYEPWRDKRLEAPYYFLQALPADNPYNTAEQWAVWKLLPEAEYKRFIEGDWSAIVDPYQLITYAQLLACADVMPTPGRRREGLDVATGGNVATGKHDDTVWCMIDGNVLDPLLKGPHGTPHLQAVNQWDEPTIAMHSLHRMTEFNIQPFDYKVDNIGVGSGVYNLMRRAGKAVRAFTAGARPVFRSVQPEGGRTINPLTGFYKDKPDTVLSGYSFQNLRGQAWWEFAQAVKERRLCIRNLPKEAVRDLTAPRFRFSSNERDIVIDSTDDIKERTGHSPDYGTAIVQAFFDFPKGATVNAAPTGSYYART